MSAWRPNKGKRYEIPCLLCGKPIVGMGYLLEIRERVHSECALVFNANLTPLPQIDGPEMLDAPLPGLDILLSTKGRRQARAIAMREGTH